MEINSGVGELEYNLEVVTQPLCKPSLPFCPIKFLRNGRTSDFMKIKVFCG